MHVCLFSEFKNNKPHDKRVCRFNILGKCRNGAKCFNKHCDVPFAWQFKVDNNWKDFEENQKIEEAYCKPSEQTVAVTEAIDGDPG